MAAKLLPRFKQDISRLVLIPSTGGCFELTVGETTIYSKLKTGRFPDEDQVIREIGKALGA